MAAERDPTLCDVAALAGLSQATASRVISGNARVSPEATAKIRSAIAKLGYVRQRSAPYRNRKIAERTTSAEKTMRRRVGARLRGIAAMHQQNLPGVTSPARRRQLETEITILLQVAEMIETSADIKL